MDRRADVVAEPRQRQLGGAASATGFVGRLVDVDRQAGAGEERARRPTRWARHRRRWRPPSSSSGSQPHASASLPAPMTGTGLSAKRQTVRSTSASLRSGRWWKSATRRAPAMVPRRTAYSAAAWPKDPSASTSSARRWASWIRRSTSWASSQSRLVVLADAVRAGPECRRAMVRYVGDRRVAVADPEADGVATLVGDVDGQHTEALDREGLRGDVAELPVAAQCRGRNRKEGR